MKDLGYHLLAILTIAIWGVTFVNTKVLLQHGLHPMEIFLLRFIVAYLCIWTISPRVVRSRSLADEGLFFVLGFLGGTVYFVAENTAIGLTYVNNVAFIVCTAPLITMLLAIAMMKGVKASIPLVAGSAMALTCWPWWQHAVGQSIVWSSRRCLPATAPSSSPEKCFSMG